MNASPVLSEDHAEGLPGPVWLTDPTGRILAANAAARQAMGRPEGWPRGAHVKDLLDGGARRTRGLWRSVRQAGGPLRVAGQFRHADGSVVPLACTLTSGIGPDGGERVMLEAATPDPAALDRAMFEIASATASTGQWYLDRRRRRLHLSGQCLGMLAHEPRRAVLPEAVLAKLVHPEDRETARALLRALFDDEIAGADLDFRVRKADGSWLWMNARARRVERNDRGLPFMVCGTCTDITARKAAEAHLAEALRRAETARNDAIAGEELLATAVVCGQMGAWSVCPDRGEYWMHDEGYRLLGHEPGSFLPDRAGWRALVHRDDIPRFTRALDRMLSGASEVYDIDLRLRHAEGSHHWYRTIARKIDRSARGLPFLLAGTFTCIDSLKENESRLSEAAEMARRAGERLNTLANNAPGAMFEYVVDEGGRLHISFFSAKLPEMLGVPGEEIAADGRAVFRAMHPEDVVSLRRKEEMARALNSRFSAKVRIRSAARGVRTLLCNALPYAREDGSIVWFANLVDITVQERAEKRAGSAAREVRIAHERLSSIANIAPVGLYEVEVRDDGSMTFHYASDQLVELLGCTRAGLDSERNCLFARVVPDDMPQVEQGLRQAFARPGNLSLRYRYLHPERGMLWLSCVAIAHREREGAVVLTGVIHDVTVDEIREEELRRAHHVAETMRIEKARQAQHDGLTGLPNRRYYDEMMAQRLEDARLGKTSLPCGLIRMDLDHFKYVNDTLGHGAGDEVLKKVARVLRGSIRSGDFAARIGGDEFSILLGPTMTAENAREIVERIQRRLEEPVLHEGRPCRFGASFGIAHTEDITEVGAELQVFADAALYRAKESGRNRLEFFTTDLHQSILSDRRIGQELHDALERDEFEPYFQPQVSSRTGALTGIETLLRWHHPERGVLSPDSFMQVAEQMRIVPEIDRIMMEKARGAMARWREAGLIIPKISFNVSSGRMHDPDVVSLARSMAVGETKVTFELLESILVEEESDAFRFHLDMIREAGIEIEIDDFGSGHASIISLMEINPTALKIDRRIVAPVARDARAHKLVRAIVEIAETLGIGTVAEGVETREQADILRDLGCDVLQGYLFARALGSEALFDHATARLRDSA